MNITDFLEARIAEDEELARTASVGMHGEHEDAGDWGNYVLGAERDSTPKQDEFIILWWPKRVLAECAAKRAIVELAEKASEAEKAFDDYEWRGAGPEQVEPWTGDAILVALAAVYKDHPDYDPAWQ